MELIRPMKQMVWRWPAVAQFTLGGMGTGFYLLGLLVAALQGGDMPQPPVLNVVFKLLGPALASLGFLALTVEAGQPLRGHNLFRHLRRSWMSRETLAGAVFIPLAVLDWVFPHPALRALAAAGAIGLMVSQGFIVYRARAVTAWNVPLVPLFFATSGFATGGGLMLLVASFRQAPGTAPGGLVLRPDLVAIELFLVVLNLAVWLLYLRWPDDAFQEVTTVLRRPGALGLTAGVGHLLPALLLVLALLAPAPEHGSALQPIAAGLASLGIIVGGVSQKAGIILKAGYLRAIVLGRGTSSGSYQRSMLPLTSDQ